VKASAPTASVASPGATRLAPAKDGSLLGAAHMTDTVMRVSSATGAATSSITLQGYSGWILGLAQAGDDIVIAPWYTEGGLIVFDGKTGARKSKVPFATTSQNMMLHGLSCPAL
jgi:hypothetical protein